MKKNKTALVIIDVQNCFIKGGNAYLPSLIKKHIEINKGKYDQIIFTRFINFKESNFVKKKDWKECFSKEGAEIVSELGEIAKISKVFIKSSYSAFKARGFIKYLKEKNIKKLYFCEPSCLCSGHTF